MTEHPQLESSLNLISKNLQMPFQCLVAVLREFFLRVWQHPITQSFSNIPQLQNLINHPLLQSLIEHPIFKDQFTNIPTLSHQTASAVEDFMENFDIWSQVDDSDSSKMTLTFLSTPVQFSDVMDKIQSIENDSLAAENFVWICTCVAIICIVTASSWLAILLASYGNYYRKSIQFIALFVGMVLSCFFLFFSLKIRSLGGEAEALTEFLLSCSYLPFTFLITSLCCATVYVIHYVSKNKKEISGQVFQENIKLAEYEEMISNFKIQVIEKEKLQKQALTEIEEMRDHLKLSGITFDTTTIAHKSDIENLTLILQSTELERDGIKKEFEELKENHNEEISSNKIKENDLNLSLTELKLKLETNRLKTIGFRENITELSSKMVFMDTEKNNLLSSKVALETDLAKESSLVIFRNEELLKKENIIANMKMKIQDSNNELDQVKSLLNGTQADLIADQIKSKNDLIEVTNKLNILEKEKIISVDRISHLEEELIEAKNSFESMEDKYKADTVQVQSTYDQIIENNKIENEIKINELKRQIETTVQTNNVVSSDLKHVQNSFSIAREEVVRVTDKGKQLTVQINTVTELLNSVNEEKTAVLLQLKSITEELNSVNEEKASVLVQLISVTDEKGAIILQLNSVTEEKATAQKKFESTTAALKNAGEKIALSTERENSLTKERTELNASVLTLRDDIIEAKEREIILKSELAVAVESNNQLKDDIDNTNKSHIKTVTEIESRRHSLICENEMSEAKLNEDLNLVNQKHSEIVIARAALQDTNGLLQMELNATKERETVLNTDLATSKEQLSSVRNELKSVQDSLKYSEERV